MAPSLIKLAKIIKTLYLDYFFEANKLAKLAKIEAATGGAHCVKSVRIRSYSGLYFPAFGCNAEI